MPGSMHYILAMTMIATGATAQVRLPAISLPALPLHFALRCAAADQQPLTLTIALMVAGRVVVATP